MKKLILFTICCLFLQNAFAGRSVQHEVRGEETAWFISQVYYGTGLKYPEILKANKLENADAVRSGMKIVIPDPRFYSSQPNFKKRYQRLAEQRDQKLKMQKTEVQKPTESSLPVGQMKAMKKEKLPFASNSNKKPSPAEMAKQELNKAVRTSESQH